MVGNKSVNGLRIESVICSNPLKINTGNTVIFINVIHDILRVANFFFVRSPGFYETSDWISLLQIRDHSCFFT